MTDAAALITVGHGTADQDTLTALLRDAGVARVADVRRFPGSRAHPHVRREALERWLPDAGIGYVWEERLGGRRRLAPDSPDHWWTVDAFRAYAGHMRTPEFRAAAGELLAAGPPTAVLCSESVWWRCHRRLIADHVTLVLGIPVRHLSHAGRLTGHVVAAGARLDGDAGIVYDHP
ncbi:DUF488 domain-containing protein [Spirilliplanes yamanashiensis]|uniref:DUF488 domain-containing protein n=1 Tax=Spirilliplanes yamanashiensis TaxID=42233 RepID=A0A8J4DKJ3_9ACTN|nr:DUF488 domain-containing protein [Spirilliplanes yamanashiensis]MDP9818150.1 uncharacterized protein (DUF488 family) [Spirilliplanes yamanashiensis]GIJ04961.1 hypothetical protein Sya03_43130 [Spirilliplanes yamanashiensis]